MTTRGGYRHPLVERIGYHAARVRAWARRATIAGLSVRAVVWLAGALALTLAGWWLGPGAVVPVAAVLALLPAGFPRGRAVSLVAVLVIAAFAADPRLWSAIVIGGLLYVHHTGAALAAQVRTDAVIPPAVLRFWAGRAGLVLAVSTLLSLAIAALATEAPAGSATAFLALGGAAAAAITAYLGWLAIREPGD
ncbi:MAG TPA: hypothetical protein VIL37_05360 [Natronosporangium sp.]